MKQGDDATDAAGDWREPPGMGRAVAMGSLVGVIVSLVGVAAVMVALDVETVSAFGLGLFVAFWGGLGFGTMVGGVCWASGLEH